jgi:transposase-like protein
MGILTMSQRERDRLVWLKRVEDKRVTLQVAATEMGISYRQAKRLWRRFQTQRDAAVVHGLRGRRSNYHGRETDQEQAVALVRQHYGDFGPTLAAEQLARRHKLIVDHETLRRWLTKAGVWQKRRKRSPHRQWREPKAHFGEMVQMDGSEHDWFERRAPRCVLMVMIDDATQRTYARFYPAETTEAAMCVFRDYVGQYGLPQSLYVDKDSIYKATRDATTDEALADTGPLTQFGRAMQELGVQLICANSPQAKGRVERRNSVFQDRLVKEMRLEKIADAAAGNVYLQKRFLEELNRRFTRTATATGDWHRPVPNDVKLDEVLSFQEARVVQNDWTVRWRNRWLQVAEAERKLALTGRKIMVRELLDGRLQLVHQGRLLKYAELLQRPVREAKPTPAKPYRRSGNKPAANHPWRRGFSAKSGAATTAERLVQKVAENMGIPKL